MPELARPRAALLEVLGFDATTRRSHSHMDVRVLPIGSEPYEASLHSRSSPSRFAGMILGNRYPGLVDDDAPGDVFVVEPTCGYRTPGANPFMDKHPMRNERTLALRERYPAPSTTEIARLLDPTTPDRLLVAARLRMNLLTTPEAAAVVDATTADHRWHEAVTRMDTSVELSMTAMTEAAEHVAHLVDVAGRPDLDVQPFLSIDAALGHRDTLDPTDVRIIVEPFERAAGPVLS